MCRAQPLLPFHAYGCNSWRFPETEGKEAIELKSHSQQKEAKGGSSHVCIEMPSQFILTLLKCANSPQLALVSSYGDRDMQQHEFCVADDP